MRSPSPDHFATSTSSSRFLSSAVAERSSYSVATRVSEGEKGEEGVSARQSLRCESRQGYVHRLNRKGSAVTIVAGDVRSAASRTSMARPGKAKHRIDVSDPPEGEAKTEGKKGDQTDAPHATAPG